MPTSQSVEYLEDMLAREISWRKKEIVAFRSAADRSSSSKGYYCRAGSVMLCAHWEGFLKAAVQFYVDHVFSQSLQLDELVPPFVAIYFYKEVMGAGAAKFPGTEERHIKLARKILASASASCNRPGWKVDTEGNPSSLVTCNILASVGLDRLMGLDESGWMIQKVFIDSQLLKDRHRVAHGERYPIRGEDFRERSNRIIAMCESLLKLIVDAANSRSYRATIG